MGHQLLRTAERLAARPYVVEIEREPGELSADIPPFTAFIKEMPYCVAQGFTEGEARQEIRSVLTDYVLSLLDRNLPVPEPETSSGSGELEFVIEWPWQGFFIYAQKSVLDVLTAPKKPLRTNK